jgi:hypothetical protein
LSSIRSLISARSADAPAAPRRAQTRAHQLQLAAALPITPGGIGVVEGTLSVLLIAYHMPVATAVLSNAGRYASSTANSASFAPGSERAHVVTAHIAWSPEGSPDLEVRVERAAARPSKPA